MRHEEVLRPVERYYTGKLEEHGASPSGVDWNSAESQELRFQQLLTLNRGEGPFTLNDYGCGYGALAEWMAGRYEEFDYRGFDVSESMLAEARDRLAGDPRCSLVAAEDELEPADYTVASGIFNVKLKADDEKWQTYVLDTIGRLAALGTRGFAFNMLTSYSDREYMRDDLYYADPCFFFDHCKRQFSRHVALLHDYGLYEFTILVRND
jgi:cyclopropane fatty-acyl-phospholipid synthase-like methyltransferase